MAIKWGNTEVKAVKWGNTTCTAVYWGNTLVFPGALGYYYGQIDSSVFKTGGSGVNISIQSTQTTQESDNFKYYYARDQIVSWQCLLWIRMADGIKFGNNQKHKYIRVNYVATNFSVLNFYVASSWGSSLTTNTTQMQISSNVKTAINLSDNYAGNSLYLGIKGQHSNPGTLRIYEIDLRES